VHADMPEAKACAVVEIIPERLSAKSDLAQGKSDSVRADLADYFKQRNRPGDPETVQAMGFDGEK